MIDKCFACGCRESTTWDEDHRDSKGGGYVDRHFVCANCGVPYAHGLIMPHDGNWRDIEGELDFSPFNKKGEQ